MDEIVKKVTALGLPGVILVITIATTGLYGELAIPIAISILGGPLGFIGGLTLLGILTLIGEALTNFGIEALLSGIYSQRRKSELLSSLAREIESLPISDELKRKVKTEIGIETSYIVDTGE